MEVRNARKDSGRFPGPVFPGRWSRIGRWHAAKGSSSPFVFYGEITAIYDSISAGHMGRMWIPAEQTVFPRYSGNNVRVALFSGTDSKYWGRVRDKDGALTGSKVIIYESPRFVSMDGIDPDGRVDVDFLRLESFQYPLDTWGC